MPTLAELNEELTAKQRHLAAVFAEAGPELDLSRITLLGGDDEGKRLEINRLNTELTEVGKKRDALAALVPIRDRSALAELEARTPVGSLVHPGTNGKVAQAVAKTLGEMFIESETFKRYSKAARSGPPSELPVDFEAKTVLTTTGWPPETTRVGPVLPTPFQMPHVADLLPSGTTTQAAVVYLEETTATNAAAGVAEGGAKPESTLAFTEKTSPVRKIATVLPITDEMMDDVPAARSYVDQRLRIFVQLAEDRDLLTGDGVAPNLLGLNNVTGILTEAVGAAPDTSIDAVFRAMMKILTTAFVAADGAVIHPLDWQQIRLAKDTTGQYLWGPPMDPGPERIWGIPLVLTSQQTQNTILVGAFRTATMLFRRSGITVAISTEHADFFVKNQQMIRAEERVALVVFRPTALCKVTGA